MARSGSSTNRPDTFAQTQNTRHKDLACNLTADHTFPTTTATRLDRKDKQLRLLHQSIGLFSSIENAGRIASDNATSEYAQRRNEINAHRS